MKEKDIFKQTYKKFIKEMKRRGYSAKYARKVIKDMKKTIPDFNKTVREFEIKNSYHPPQPQPQLVE